MRCRTPGRLYFCLLLWALPVALGAMSGAAPASAQGAYPNRHVRIITNAGLGSSPDVLARIIADELSRLWRQQVIVENNSAGGGIVAAQRAADAAPDGYTLLVASASAFTVLPIRQEHAPVMIGTNLKPVAFLGASPMAFAVSPKLGVTSIKELVALSRSEPDRIFYAANQTGSLPHMSGEYFKSRTGASLTFVPYRGAADGLTSVLSGQTSLIIENYLAIKGAIQSGELVLLAFSARERLPNFPEVPTVAETAPGFVAIGWAALMAPIGVPDDIVNKVHTDIRRIFDQPGVRQRMIALGIYPAFPSTAELANFIEQEQAQWSPIIRNILAAPSAAPAKKADRPSSPRQ